MFPPRVLFVAMFFFATGAAEERGSSCSESRLARRSTRFGRPTVYIDTAEGL